MALGINVTTRNAMLDAITARAGASALLRIYDGSRPSRVAQRPTYLRS